MREKEGKKDEEIGGNCLAINQSLDVLLMNRTAQTFIASLMRRASTRIHTSTTDIHTLTHLVLMLCTRSSNNHNHYHKKHRLNMNENWCEK